MTVSSLKRSVLLTTFLTAMVLGTTGSRCADNEPEPEPECVEDADCGDGRCDDGECVGCLENGDCAAGEFCCANSCYAESEVESHCGCSPTGTSDGFTCGGTSPVCLVGISRATAATVTSGSCGCSCDAALGGPDCTLDDAAADGFICTCEDNDACTLPALDSEGVPHVVADICTPNGDCECYEERAVCDPNSARPDCTLRGCQNAYGDEANCGVPARVCTDEATGIDGAGTCINGGCTCNDANDCTGTDLNVDSCTAVQTSGGNSVLMCVCDDFERDGQEAPCPLGLGCEPGGCNLDGTIHADWASLMQALGVAVDPSSIGGGDAGAN